MKSRIISQQKELEEVITACDVCYVGMVDSKNKPFVLPFNFGYKDKTIYLHSSQTGKKITILKENNNVCIVFSTDHELRYVHKKVACSWGMKFRSVLVYGKVEFIHDYDEKIKALDIVMTNYTDMEFSFGKPSVDEVLPWKVRIDKIEGKARGH